MLFKNQFGKHIRMDRESVCMADDVMAPNEKILNIESQDRLSDMIQKAASCLPRMRNSVWPVDSGKEVIAYIIMGEDEEVSFELCQEDRDFAETGIGHLHCRYFYPGRFVYRNGENGEVIEKYPECKTLLEKVKRQIEENG